MKYFATRFIVLLLCVAAAWYVLGRSHGYEAGFEAAEAKYLVGKWSPIGDRGVPRLAFDLTRDAAPYRDATAFHLHCPEEINGGGYRGGKFTYIYQGDARP